jgi:carboxyl-terminal processing protease
MELNPDTTPDASRGAPVATQVKTFARLSLYILICILVVGITFALGYTTRATHAPVAEQAAAFSVFWESWRLIDDHFYGDSSNIAARTYGAIKGSLSALDDPYTIFVEPQRRDREQEELRGSFGGIGAWIERKADGRIILTPMDDRPAAKAGILTGDQLIAVNDAPLYPEMPFNDILAMVRGEVGEIVRLTIRREGHPDPLVFEVRRGEIVTPSVSSQLKPPDVGYIRISIFNERTNDELEVAIRNLGRVGATKYVIDLRSNGGGLLTPAIEVASQFLEDGVVMYERRNSGEEKPYPVKKRGVAREEPVVILVNGGTASASEIVAGAIQDHERGILIGTETFGKASVQLLFDLSDGSSLHVTSARWLRPSRQEIDGVGLKPDLQVELTDQDRENDRDPQLDQAMQYLQESEP